MIHRGAHVRTAGLIIIGLLPASVGAQAAQTRPWNRVELATGEYTVDVDSSVARSGRRSLRIDGFTTTPLGGGSVLQQIRADRFRGKRVRVSAYVRTRNVRGLGGTIAVAVAGEGRVVAQSRLDQAPLTGSRNWQLLTAVVDVPGLAVGLNITGTLEGAGTTWFDNFRIEVIGNSGDSLHEPVSGVSTAQAQSLADHFRQFDEQLRDADFERIELARPLLLGRSPLEAPQLLSARGLDNLFAFTRLVGVVRHFYPTEQVRTTNWSDFTIRAVRLVERAPNAESLARTLRTLFEPIAPDIVITVGTTTPKLPKARVPSQNPSVTWWSNIGIALAPPEISAPGRIYSSSLLVRRAAGGRVPRGVPHPDSAWSAVLGAGLAAAVPVARWTVFSSNDSASKSVQPVDRAEAASPNDRATRLAGVIGLWNVFQHSYPYFDVVKVDWPTELRRALRTAATDRSPAEYQATLERLVAALQDGHGRVYPIVAQPRRAFLPVALDWVENQLVVSEVGPEADGLQRGDIIERIDGVPADSVLALREQRISGATPQWRRYRAVQEVTVGPERATVQLRVRPALSSPGARTTRDVRLTYSSTLRTRNLPETIAELQAGIFYVDLDRINDADFLRALPRLQKARGIIFDLRGYPNSVSTPLILARLSASTLRSAYFEVPTFTRPDRTSVQWRDGGWTLEPVRPRLTAKIAFLTGGGAISYAESTMGIVEQYRLGAIVGESTAGTNGNVNAVPVPGGYQVSYTGMRVRKRDATPHHGVGIKPTVPVTRTLAGVAQGIDEVLERGIGVVGGQARQTR
jgi:C-terminal processing protease CtpA/Prc